MRARMSRVVRVVLVGVVGTVAGGFAVSGSAAGPSSVEDQPRATAGYLVCTHTDGSRWECSDSSMYMIARGNDVLGGALTLRLADGRTARFTLGAGVDAIFFTPEGIEILAEHYDRGDRQKAAEVRAALEAARRRAAARTR